MIHCWIQHINPYNFLVFVLIICCFLIFYLAQMADNNDFFTEEERQKLLLLEQQVLKHHPLLYYHSLGDFCKRTGCGLGFINQHLEGTSRRASQDGNGTTEGVVG